MMQYSHQYFSERHSHSAAMSRLFRLFLLDSFHIKGAPFTSEYTGAPTYSHTVECYKPINSVAQRGAL